MRPKVWIAIESPPAAIVAPLAELAELATGGDPRKLPGSAVVVTGGVNKVDAAFMDRVGPSLQLVTMPGIGLDHIDVKAASEREILVCNNPDAPTQSTAEHTVALLMAATKRVIIGDMQVRGTDLPRADLRGTELRGLTLGVLGYGRIGRRVAEICAHGLGMSVLVHDPWVEPDPQGIAGIRFTDDLDEVFVQADCVTLHTPLIAGTRHLVSERRLRLMKRGSYLINASRGGVIDEAALIRALQDGHLAGAGLDVFDPEPPAADNPLLGMPNVVMTPHNASNTHAGFLAKWGGTVNQIIQVLRGERPANLANPDVWPGRVGGG